MAVCNTAFAQLVGWQYNVPVVITETSGTAISNYQVGISFDTQTLINAGKMNVDASDLRVGEDILGSSLLYHWIEKGINTTNTIIWVKIPFIAANDSVTIYFFYGNPSALSTSNVDSTLNSFYGGAIPGTVTTVSNTIPFGRGDGYFGTYKGFTYQNIEEFFVLPGTQVCFDLGALNDVDITINLDICATTVNGNNICDGIGYSNLLSGKTASTPLGNTVCSDFELCFDIDSLYHFWGQGMKLRISASGGFVLDNIANYNLCGTTSSDASGKFVERFWNDESSISQDYIGGFVVDGYTRTNTVTPEPSQSIGSESLMTFVSVNDIQICSGDSGILAVLIDTNSSLVPPYTFTWTPSTGLACNTCQSTYASPTTTTVYTVIVTDSNGIQDSAIATVTVSSSLPIANAGADTSFCEGNSIQLNGSGGVTYSWSPGISLSDSLIANPIATPLVTTNYILVASNGCGTDSDTVTVSIDPLPVILSSDTTLCPGDSIQLAASGAISYNWSPGSSLNDSTIATPYAQPSFTTTYSLSATSSMGCILNETVTVIIDSVPELLASSSNDTICLGDSTQLFVNGCSPITDDFDPGIDSLNWSSIIGGFATTNCGSVSGFALYFNGSPIRTATTKNLNVLSGGTIDFSLKIGSGSSPCEDADPGEEVILEYSINNGISWTNINTYSTTAFINFTFVSETIPINAQTAATMFRWNQPVHSGSCCDHWAIDDVNIACSGVDTSLAFLWTPSSGLSDPSIYNPTASPTSTTTYIVEASIGSCISADTITIYVDSVNTITASADTTLCAGDSVQLNASGAIFYTWSPATGLSCTNCSNPVAGPTTDITYIVTSPAGCTPTDSISIDVNGVDSLILTSTKDSICPGDTTQLYINGGCTGSEFYDGFESGNISTWTDEGGVYPKQVTTISPNSGNFALEFIGGVGSHLDGLSHTFNPSTPNKITWYMKSSSATEYGGFVAIGDNPVNVFTDGLIYLFMNNDGTFYLNSGYVGSYNANQWHLIELQNIDFVSKTFDFYVDNNLVSASVSFSNTSLSLINEIHLYTWGSTANSYFDDVTIGEVCNTIDSTAIYTWSPSLGLSDPNIANPVANPTTTTTYAVNVNDGGCINTDSITVYVAPLVTDAGSDTTLCPGDSAQLLATSNLQGVTYSWSPGSNLTCTSCPDPIATPSDTTTYYVIGVSGACTSNDSVIVFMKSFPIADAGADTNFCFGSSVQLTATGGIGYVWSPSSYASCTICDKTSVDPPSDMTYYVTVTDSIGCSAMDSVFVAVNGQPISAQSAKPSVCSPGDTTQLSVYGGCVASEFYDGFESGNISTWVDNGGLYTKQVTTSNPYNGNYALEFVGGVANHLDGINHTFNASTPDYISLYMKSTSTTEYGGFFVVGANPIGSVFIDPLIYLFMNNDGTFYLNSGFIGSYNANQWHFIELRNIDFISKTYDFYIDNILISLSESFQNTALNYVDLVHLYAWSSTANSYFDDVAIGNPCNSVDSSMIFTWSPGTSLSDSTIINPIASPTTNTTYIVTADDQGCFSSDTITIFMDSTVVAAYSDTSICVGGSAQLNVTSNTPVASYGWNPSAGLSNSAIANPIATPTVTTSYSVKVTNTMGCQNFDTVIVTVDAPPNAMFTHSANGLTVQFNDASTNASTWEWDFGNGFNATIQNPQYTYSMAGTYYVCLMVYNACDSAAYCDTITITDSTGCPPPAANFSYSSSGFDATFTNSSTISGNASYSWDFGDGIGSSTLENPSYTYTISGTYNVCLTIQDSCGADTICQAISVIDSSACPPPTAGFTFSVNSLSATFTNTSIVSGNATYTWDFGDGGSSSQPNPIYNYITSGAYIVCLTITDSCGNDFVCQIINASDTLSIKNLTFENLVEVFPNPTNGIITIVIPKSSTNNLEISIYSMIGNLVWVGSNPLFESMNGSKDLSKTQIDIKELSAGPYLIKIQSESQLYVEEIIYNK